jgi:hypothetical protein
MRAVFRVIKRMLFMVPPLAVRAGATASSAGGADRDGSTNLRFGRGESGFWEPLAHALKSQVVCCDER